MKLAPQLPRNLKAASAFVNFKSLPGKINNTRTLSCANFPLTNLTMATAQPEKKKERPSALRSIIAGSTAGAVEIGMPLTMNHRSFANLCLAITYPAECTSVTSAGSKY